MTPILSPRRALLGSVLAVGLALSLAPAHAERTTSPLADLVGQWTGNGTVSLANGASERIRCQAAYAPGTDASNLRSLLRCASDSYKFELASDIVDQAGRLSGAWKEVTRNVSGPVAGSVTRGELQAQIDMPGFAARLTIATQGNRQVVSVKSEGSELAGVSITLNRR
ncbi:MAG TPA: hypothetical protein VHL98_17775 [Microvirga sp.]|jgi:hypothetical protein|nr:hypothetical protein [Microvirga sp.]